MRVLCLALGLSFTVAASAATSERISPKTALQNVQSGKAVVVDVREPAELKSGKVTAAQNFAYSNLNSPAFDGFVKSLPKDKEIYTYCEKGGRADKVAEALRAKGFNAHSTGG